MAESLFGADVAAAHFRPLVGDLRQLACVRRIVLDDGPERGVRALAFSTGGGLDFWVLTDRSFDIGPLWLRGTPVAWQSASGFRGPGLHDAADEDGAGFNRSLSGFLVTCGLDHVRQPRGGKPLHGRLPLTPGRLIAHGEDWRRGEPVLFCEGEVTQARYDGEALRLHRRIEAPIGGNVLRIEDRVENLLPEPQAHDILYHFNLGFPAYSDATRIELDGQPLALPGDGSPPAVLCRRAAATRGVCTLDTPLGRGGSALSVSIAFGSRTLPFLQVWADPRPHRRILGIEPCASERVEDGTSAERPPLPAAASCSYSVEVAATTT